MKKRLQIAIDGPVAAGKGDIAQRLAKKLGLLYLYTGAMYRALALAMTRSHVVVENKSAVIKLLQMQTIELLNSKEAGQFYRVILNGEDVTHKIHTPQIDMLSSAVSTIAEIRKEMVFRQQQMAQNNSVVMEGRDIGLRVMPNADIKLYLTADLEERARRRHLQMMKRGMQKSFEQVLSETKKRDEQDQSRDVDPLQKLPEAVVVDTTRMTQSQVVEKIVVELKMRKLL